MGFATSITRGGGVGFCDATEYCEAIQKKVLNEEWGRWLAGFHWDLYLIPTFCTEVTDDYAMREGKEFVRTFGPLAYGFVVGGEGRIGGRMHIHALVGGLFDARANKDRPDLRMLNIRKARWSWKHGVMAKAELYDLRQGAVWYLPHHPEFEIVGNMRRHRSN